MTIGEYLFIAVIETPSLKIRSLHYSRGISRNTHSARRILFLGGTFRQVSNNTKHEANEQESKAEHSISPGGLMRISRIGKSIGLAVGMLSLSIAG